MDNFHHLNGINMQTRKLPCYERLHQDAYTRASTLSTNKKLLEALMDVKHTLVPKDDNKTKLRNNFGILERARNLESTKSMSFDQMIKNVEEDELTFCPKISESSKRIVRKRFSKTYASVPVGHRLFEMARQKDSYLDEKIKGELGIDSQKTNSQFSQIDISNFLRRVEISEHFREKKISLIKAKSESDMTFKPRITESSQKILAADPIRFYETMEERIDRLAIQDVKKREITRNLISKQYQFDFQPKISQLSIKLATMRTEKSKRNISEINTESKPDFRRKESEVEPKIDAKIKTNRRFSKLQSIYKDPNAIMLHIDRNRQCKMEKIKSEKEQAYQKELSQCTFRPEIKTKEFKKTKSNNLEVKGLVRFYELKTMAVRQQEQEKQRYNKVFNYNHELLSRVNHSI